MKQSIPIYQILNLTSMILNNLSNVIPFDSPGKISKTPNHPEVRFNIIDVMTSKNDLYENIIIE